MRNHKLFRTAAWGLALGLGVLTGLDAAHAEEGDGKKVEKHRVVVINKDGKQQVIEGDGPLMKRGYLGVALLDLTPELRAHFGAPEDAGVLVSKVEDGSPADKAGLKVGDILTSVDGSEVKSSWDVGAKVRRMDDGKQIPLSVLRNGRSQNLSATIVERERPEIDMGPIFFKEKDGDRMILRMDRDEMMRLPHRIPMPGGPGAEEGERVRVERRLVSPREIELEKQLKELEKRIAELEKQLKRQN
jgi:membrane-associated protease RseP (regulator of RpoE activity)